MIGNLNITWIDNNHATIQDPEFGRTFSVTVQPKTVNFVAGKAVKTRLYVGGIQVTSRLDFPHNQQVKWAKEYFQPVLEKILNKRVKMRFSSTAGCKCGCSPGFIIDELYTPFDIWITAD